ncbi:reverse transcriptase domain-containing protein [Synechocystis sp. PCC 7338]|uniref:reverse transcriptase domain-containing protein n=1 Tax=Synechocystis sp. PCC 7338 TaxID=2732530 RepID=UPI001BB097AF|nr:reverse transcriptase domain-containing protein [Synechocystis sp. PCC 7338]QUS61119.1 RNA-directed DNA polymerase [Synechocystis sp. PCC 7338]
MLSSVIENKVIVHPLDRQAQAKERFVLPGSQTELRQKFLKLQTPDDVARLLNLDYRRLAHHIYHVPTEQKYKTFTLPKKTGGERTISTPVSALKIIQWKLNQLLTAVYEVKPSAHGFVQGKNIVTNAKVHAGKRFVLNLDLADFFGSVNFGRVRGLFMATPYNLPAKVATVLAQICCHEDKLPQGAPTSPIITNMLCAKMDSQLQRLAKECRATYTRYADDITFSTTLKEFPEALAYAVETEDGDKLLLGDRLLNIIADNGFNINEKKVRLQVRGNHQEVTGLTTNEFPNVKRTYVRQIRAMLHAWAKFGLEAAEKEYHERYNFKARFALKEEASFKQVLKGKIEFLGMVKGKKNLAYNKFLKSYYNLTNFGKK